MFPAYIGPGAGFAFLGSFLILFVAVLLAIVSALTFPLRFTLLALLRRKKGVKSSIKRIVVLGLDGLDPRHVRRLLDKGDMPHFSALAEHGVFSELETTCPPISPVAWSSFTTGVNPGKHNIFDFLNRNLHTYMPELSSSRLSFPDANGVWPRPRGASARGRRPDPKERPEIALLRKSKPFWQILGEYGIFSTILRVPVTFPPEKFHGLSLSAMCTPDLRGTQGTFTLYETSSNEEPEKTTGGLRIPVKIAGRRITTYLPGPPAGGEELRTPLVIELDKDSESAVLRISGQRIRLVKGMYSDWITVTFKAGMKKITGICRFLLISAAPEFKLYVTPLNIDPQRPAMPISHPLYYSIYLAKLHGPYATLGLAEDTWALNEKVIDDAAFLQQAYDIQHERENMFLDALKRTRRGLCCCVFDLPDRIQHMFYRYIDDGVSALNLVSLSHKVTKFNWPDPASTGAIDNAYRQMDALVGRTMEDIDENTVLFVISDHGFESFRRGVNLNVWLEKNGFLALNPDASGKEYLADVDWEQTQAYSFGLSGIYLNIKGRESRGIVSDDEKRAMKAEIIQKLRGLKDPATNETAIRAVYDSEDIYSGPYRDNGPDMIVGYEAGYRASWENAVGRTDGNLFTDNTKCWSGDHCIDQNLVPGVFFCNQRLSLEHRKPHIIDLAPTILSLFGIDKPEYMDGRALVVNSH